MALMLRRNGAVVGRRPAVRYHYPFRFPEPPAPAVVELGSRVTRGDLSGRVAVLWSELAARRIVVRVYLDWPHAGSPWFDSPLSEWAFEDN